jgi:peptide/nickel transport system substrate-binding protein
VTVFTAPGQTYEHLDFRMDHPLLRDKAFRQAIAACIDRQDLVDRLIKDVDPHAVPLGSLLLFTPTELGYQDHYADTGNVGTARRILTDSGYTLGTDGIFTKHGQRLPLRLGHRGSDRRNQTTRLIQSHCAPAGIEILDDAADNFNDTRIAAGEFDLALFAWVDSPVKSSSYGNYASIDAGGNANYNKYSNRKLDTTLARANTELDFTKRLTILDEADKLMRADLHSLPLFALPDFAASDQSITPISYLATAGGITWNLFTWQRN